jgi:hypothetical protein
LLVLPRVGQASVSAVVLARLAVPGLQGHRAEGRSATVANRRESVSLRSHMETLGRERTHAEDGVDLTLIRWMLSLSPAERLEASNDMRE